MADEASGTDGGSPSNARRLPRVFLGLTLLGIGVAYRWVQAPSTAPPAPDAFSEPAATAEEMTTLQGRAFGTSWSVKLLAPAVDDESAARAVQETLESIDAAMSTYRDDSTISRLNRAPVGAWIAMGPEFATVFEVAREVHEASDGAFDPTVGRLVRAWGFGRDDRPAAAPDVASLLGSVGLEHLETRRDPPAIRRSHPDVELDLSAVAKGYAVDAVVAALADLGVTRCMVEIGGEVRTLGTGAGDRPWRIGVERPSAGARQPLRVVPLQDAAMATSGEYRNVYELDGRTVSHTIDPRTGHPVTHDLASVTVVAATCARADAWATALNVLGAEQGATRATSAGVEYLLYTGANGEFEEFSSPGFPLPTDDR